jgi:xylulokinase
MLAAVGIGWFDSFAEAAETCVEVDSVTKPDPEKFRLYESIFQTYKAIHDALAPIYSKK